MTAFIDSPPVVIDENGVTFTPVLGGYRVEHLDGGVEYLYFSPASSDTDNASVAFVYYDEGDRENPEVHIVVGES